MTVPPVTMPPDRNTSSEPRVRAAVMPLTDPRCDGLLKFVPMQPRCTTTQNPRLLIAIAGAGGALAVYGQPIEANGYRYKVMMLDQTPEFLNEDKPGATIKRDSGWLLSWSAAIRSLSRFPWPQLAGMYVDPNLGRQVWTAIQEYQRHSPRPVRDGALRRWRQVCGV
jgi:hypothetical protein